MEELHLDDHQRTVSRLLSQKKPELGTWYLSALTVLNTSHVIDRIALAAHGLREVLEKLPNAYNLALHCEPLGGKVNELEDVFKKVKSCAKHTSCDAKMKRSVGRFLDACSIFFKWKSTNNPRRLEETKTLLNQFDPSQLVLPAKLQDVNANKWEAMRDYFNKVAHHGFSPSELEFRATLREFEGFLRDKIAPEPSAELDNIDAVIKEAEK